MACQRGSLHLLFLVLLLAPAAFSDLCSRQLSREAQEIISMELSVLLLELHLNVSNHCVFDPSADMYKDQEAHKEPTTGRHIMCGYCKKAFRTDAYLDAHMDRAHTSTLGQGCLADACGLLRCPSYRGLPSTLPKSERRAWVMSCKRDVHACFPDSTSPDAVATVARALCADADTITWPHSFSSLLSRVPRLLAHLLFLSVALSVCAWFVLAWAAKRAAARGTRDLLLPSPPPAPAALLCPRKKKAA